MLTLLVIAMFGQTGVCKAGTSCQVNKLTVTSGFIDLRNTANASGIRFGQPGTSALMYDSAAGWEFDALSGAAVLTCNHGTQQCTAVTALNSPVINSTAVFRLNGNTYISTTAPTLGAGWGTSPTIVGSNGTAVFQINVGTGGTATNGTITLPAATTGWFCTCEDVTTINTTVARCRQTGLGTTTSVNIGNYTSADIAGAWASSDKILVSCMAY